MTDLTTHATIAAGAASSVIAAAGTVYGVEYVVLFLALLGGATSLIYLAKMTVTSMLASVVGSTVLGVVAAQFSTKLIIATAVYFLPFLTEALKDSYLPGKLLIAFLVGFSAQKVVPIFFNWLDRKGS